VARQVPAPVLIVDDNPETLDVLRRVMSVRGYKTVTAEDGLDALTYLRGGGRASVIVLDMRMPNMDGWAFRRALAADARFAAIPIVIFSADPRAAEAEGVVGCVLKGSADPEVLLDLIERATTESTL
jgi:two-component system, chemotaxis family, chemotaxis protein CheY